MFIFYFSPKLHIMPSIKSRKHFFQILSQIKSYNYFFAPDAKMKVTFSIKNHISTTSSTPSLFNHLLTTLDQHPSFYFFHSNPQVTPSGFSNFPIRFNRKVSPLSSKATSYSFWSASQLSHNFSSETLSKSIIVNPYKNENFIKSAIQKGITQMVINDIEEFQKIHNTYFNLLSKKNSPKQPKVFWMVDDLQEDFQNVKLLKDCDLPLDGLFFSEHVSLQKAKRFENEVKALGFEVKSMKESKLKEYQLKEKEFKEKGIIPEIVDYSEVDQYTMACRIIGTDKNSNPVFAEECNDFICSPSMCSCGIKKSLEIVDINGVKWALVNPKRIDKITPQMIVCAQGCEETKTSLLQG